jgi:hypothetical protein
MRLLNKIITYGGCFEYVQETIQKKLHIKKIL